MGMGIRDTLAQITKAGYPPFAVVSVDGGDGYWHRRASGEDSGAMVLTELLPMLAAKGLDTSKVGFIGWSMGGYGALLLGGRLGPARTAAICAVSPALYTSYDKAVAAGAFDSTADFVRYSVFGAPALSAIPLRVDAVPATGSIWPLSNSSRPYTGRRPGSPSMVVMRLTEVASIPWHCPCARTDMTAPSSADPEPVRETNTLAPVSRSRATDRVRLSSQAWS